MYLIGARITTDKDGMTHISYHLKDRSHILELFENRAALHLNCYQHITVLGIEEL